MMSVFTERDTATAGCCADCGQAVMRRTPLSDEHTKIVREVCILPGPGLSAPAVRIRLLWLSASRARPANRNRAWSSRVASADLAMVIAPQSFLS